jgi:DNA-directed RNA polymerase subunit RPC12/RpoP
MSAIPTAFMQEVIAASDVPTDPLRCPHCGGRHLHVQGRLCFPHEEVRLNDDITSKTTDFEYATPFFLDNFACLTCKRAYTIQADEEVRLIKELSIANETILKLSGKPSHIH